MITAGSVSHLLPVCRAPRKGEGLFGFLLALDHVHRVAAGTTAQIIGRHATRLSEPAMQFAGTSFDLARLAAINGISDVDVEALTLRRQIGSFGRQGARTIGLGAAFRICPACVGESVPYVALESALPLVSACNRHGGELIRLETACWACNRPLRAFGTYQLAFHCECGRTWSDAVSRPIDGSDAARARRVLELWRWLLEVPRFDVFRAVRRLMGANEQRLRDAGALAEDVPPAYHLPPNSLMAIVRRMVDLDLSIEAVSRAAASHRRIDHRCLNQTCLAPASAIRLNGSRTSGGESYCSRCGSRFLGDRIIVSFDFGHGDPRLSDGAVLRARARLQIWRSDLSTAATRMRLAHGPRVKVSDVFKAAGVPDSAHLRASRLRMREVIRLGLKEPLCDMAAVPWELRGIVDPRWRLITLRRRGANVPSRRWDRRF